MCPRQGSRTQPRQKGLHKERMSFEYQDAAVTMPPDYHDEARLARWNYPLFFWRFKRTSPVVLPVNLEAEIHHRTSFIDR